MSSTLKRPIYLGVILAVLALVFSVAPTAMAQDEGPDRDRPLEVVDFQGVHPNTAGLTGVHPFLVRFDGAPAAQVYAEALESGTRASAVAATQAAIASNTAQQEAVAADLNAMGARQIFAVQRVLNAVMIYADASNVEAIAALPGVQSVTKAAPRTLDHGTSIPYIDADAAWAYAGGTTGEGIKVGIIDTGIDYLHLNYSGTADYTGQDPTVVTDGGFPTAKVAGGVDFVGAAYDASSDDPAINTPVPDNDPTDCNGHGTHVAGSAAGQGVFDDAGTPTTYTGPYDETTIATVGDDWIIGPGVAPEATLYAIKVFGCDGSTLVTIQGIEWSVDPNGDGNFSDRLDVINLSLGADYGIDDDGTDDAMDNAALAGVIPVTSAGNAADNTFILGTPGTATRAITVAAIADADNSTAQLEVGDAEYAAFPAGYGPALDGDLTGTIAVPSGEAEGCSPDDFGSEVEGNIALVDRGACAFVDKTLNAQAAGATAVVITNVTTNVPFGPGGTTDEATIPTVMISGDAGNEIKAGLPATGTLTPEGQSLEDTIAGFSSRGPARPDPNTDQILLKPDVTAPGVAITSALTGYTGASADAGSEPLTIGGTSMASPHAAGIMALLRETYPGWTVEELKALIMNTTDDATEVVTFDALNNALTDEQVNVSRQGAGFVNAFDAVSTDVIAYALNNRGAVSVSFPTVDVVGDMTEVVNVVVKNKSPMTQTVDFASIDTIVDSPGIDFFVNSSPADVNVDIPPYSQITIAVGAEYDHDMLAHAIDPTMELEQLSGPGSPNPRHYINEEGAFLNIVFEGDGPDLRVPLYSAARAASEMYAQGFDVSGLTPAMGEVSTSGDIELLGQDVLTGVTPVTGTLNDVSLVGAFELMLSDGRDPYTADGAGDQYPEYVDWADIQYLGVSSDAQSTGAGGFTTSFIGVSMYDNWATPIDFSMYTCVDLDQDGTGGYFGDGSDWCWITTADAESDVPYVLLWDINDFLGQVPDDPATDVDEGVPGFAYLWDFVNHVDAGAVNTRYLNNNVMFHAFETGPTLWGAFAESLFGVGLVDGNWTTGGTDSAEAFDFYTYTTEPFDGNIVDMTDTMTYDPTDPIVTFTTPGPVPGVFGIANTVYLDQNGATIPVEINAPVGTPAEVLLLHHHNTEDSRAEVVTLDPGFELTDLLDGQGGFEDGTLDPWTAIGNASVIAAPQAPEGGSAVVIDGTGSGPSGIQAVFTDLTGGEGDYMTVEYYIGGLQVNALGVGVRIFLQDADGNNLQVGLCLNSFRGTGVELGKFECVVRADQAFEQATVQLGALGLTGRLGFDEIEVYSTSEYTSP